MQRENLTLRSWKLKIKQRTFGDHVLRIEHVALHNIERLGIKNDDESVRGICSHQSRCKKKSAKEEGVDCEFYAGLSDATGLFSPSVAFAAVLHDMKTYYTRGRRRYYHNEYVLEIENLNNITSVKSWIEANEYHKQNLKYLVALIELEEEPNQKITSKHISNKVQTGKQWTRPSRNWKSKD